MVDGTLRASHKDNIAKVKVESTKRWIAPGSHDGGSVAEDRAVPYDVPTDVAKW